MDIIDIISAWGFGWLVPILIGIALGVLQMNDFKLAKRFFFSSAILAEAKVVMLGLTVFNNLGWRIFVSFIASGLIGVLLVESFRYVDSKRDAQIAAQPQSNIGLKQEVAPFSVEVRFAFVSDSGALTSFMVGYPSILGKTTSPVFYLAYIQITNLQDIPSNINDFKIAVSKEPEGQYESLVQIPLNLTNLYWLQSGKALSQKEVKTESKSASLFPMPNGTMRLATRMNKKNMKKALEMVPDQILESELTNPIQPHSLVGGWIALDSLRKEGLSPGQIYFRITLNDTANKNGVYVVPLPIKAPGDTSMRGNNGSLILTGVTADISAFKVKYYGDPFSSP